MDAVSNSVGTTGGFRQTPGAGAWNTWPEWFWKHGYYSAGCGKLYHPGDPASFDPQSWSEPQCKENFPYFGQGSCPIPKSEQTDGGGCAVDPSLYPNATFPDEETLKVGLSFLRKAAAQRNASGTPFWLGVGFVKPHLPHVFPKKFGELVPAVADIELPPNPNVRPKPSIASPVPSPQFQSKSPPLITGRCCQFTTGCPTIEWLSKGPAHAWDKPATPESTRSLRHAYYSAAAFSDSLLGELLGEVDTLGRREDTAVVLTADHGWGLGEHNHWIKYTTWETDTRVPMMLRAPWATAIAGKRTDALVEHVDLYPSLAEIAGVPVDNTLESIDGESWASLLDDPAGQHKAAAYSQYPRCWPANHTHDASAFTNMARCSGVDKHLFAFMGFSIRTSDFRYTEWAAWDGAALRPLWNVSAGVELYDHTADPPESAKDSFERFENLNVAAAQPATAAKLSAQLRAFFDAH